MRKIILGLLAIAALTTGATFLSSPVNAATATTPDIYQFSASPGTFYPTVRDGFRDGVDFNGEANPVASTDPDSWEDARQEWSIVIRNSRGVKVAEKSGNEPDNGNLYWRWSGKKQSTGMPVPVGTYQAVLTVTNTETNETDTATRTLYAKSDTVNKRITKTRNGTDTSARSHSSSCYIDRDWGTSHLELDCWGGREAAVRYGFTIPSNATNVTWSAPGTRGCCDNGRVTKTGTRTSSTHFDVRVRVTNWASYTINRATVTYTTRVHR